VRPAIGFARPAQTSGQGAGANRSRACTPAEKAAQSVVYGDIARRNDLQLPDALPIFSVPRYAEPVAYEAFAYRWRGGCHRIFFAERANPQGFDNQKKGNNFSLFFRKAPPIIP